MRIISIGADDVRFRTVRFSDGAGLNLLVAEKTRTPGAGDSRNGTGKTALALLLRYILGGSKPRKLTKSTSLSSFEFFGVFDMPGPHSSTERVTVRRAFNSTKVRVEGWSFCDSGPISVSEWTGLLGKHVFCVPDGMEKPSVGQLVGQFIRTDFLPTKIHSSEPDWESGCRYAFLFGLDVGIAARAGEVARLTKQQKVLNQAAKDGALEKLDLDVARLKGRLAMARRERNSAVHELSNFQIEERYRDHQFRANALSKEIREFNEHEVILQRKVDDLERALSQETNGSAAVQLATAVESVYQEAGVTFPEIVLTRFVDVQAFHSSVIRNRILFLEEEQSNVAEMLNAVRRGRSQKDDERSNLLALLHQSVALDTYREAQSSLASLEGEIAALESRLAMAEAFENLGEARDVLAADTRRKMRLEVTDNEPNLDEARALFSAIAAEIYGQGSGKFKRASLDLGVSSNQGGFLVNPEVAADGSAGISSVKTFIMDMVTMCMAIRSGHSPGFLVHDSGLFDPVDSEQIASCLNIGARLSREQGFQYIVTMNSDTLDSAVVDSGYAFDHEDHMLDLRLSDSNEDQKLFGFDFD